MCPGPQGSVRALLQRRLSERYNWDESIPSVSIEAGFQSPCVGIEYNFGPLVALG